MSNYKNGDQRCIAQFESAVERAENITGIKELIETFATFIGKPYLEEYSPNKYNPQTGALVSLDWRVMNQWKWDGRIDLQYGDWVTIGKDNPIIEQLREPRIHIAGDRIYILEYVPMQNEWGGDNPAHLELSIGKMVE
jgi:hypothetical protein